jgi:hypothetical protein
MTKRTNTKIGDIFSVKINNTSKKYLQLIAFDLTQLNSDVVRAFKAEYPINSNPDVLEIVNGEVEFYAHCVTKWGVKLGYWEKYGSSDEVGKTDHILFRGTNDYGHKIGNEPIKISNNWYIWKINDEKFTRVGKLLGENQKAEIGMVINPESIVYRIKNGEYDFPFYPGYE